MASIPPGPSTFARHPEQLSQFNESLEHPVGYTTMANTSGPNILGSMRQSPEYNTTLPHIPYPPQHAFECEVDFISDNDPEYNKWREQREAERRTHMEFFKSLEVVPDEITSLPGHFGPSRTETSSQVIGQYLDLRPYPPKVYPELDTPLKCPQYNLLVKYIPSNIRSNPAIPDHPFIVEKDAMMDKNKDNYFRGLVGAHYTAAPPGVIEPKIHEFKTSHVYKGRAVGEREPGKTLPYLAPTGLEFNRHESGKPGGFEESVKKVQNERLQRNRHFPRYPKTDIVGVLLSSKPMFLECADISP